MKASIGRIQESKRAFRQKLANAPIAEKLQMLDALRERMLAIRRGSNAGANRKAVVHQTPPATDR